MKKILLLFMVVSCTAFAQITITSGDVANMFAVGITAQQLTKTPCHHLLILAQPAEVITGISQC
jgi:hypothetical protein